MKKKQKTESKNVRIARKKDDIEKAKRNVTKAKEILKAEEDALKEIKKEGKIYGDPQAEIQW